MVDGEIRKDGGLLRSLLPFLPTVRPEKGVDRSEGTPDQVKDKIQRKGREERPR